MESYIVHIHRRPAEAGGGVLAGVVERTDSAVTRPFASLAELLALLGLGAFGRVLLCERRS